MCCSTFVKHAVSHQTHVHESFLARSGRGASKISASYMYGTHRIATSLQGIDTWASNQYVDSGSWSCHLQSVSGLCSRNETAGIASRVVCEVFFQVNAVSLHSRHCIFLQCNTVGIAIVPAVAWICVQPYLDPQCCRYPQNLTNHTVFFCMFQATHCELFAFSFFHVMSYFLCVAACHVVSSC